MGGAGRDVPCKGCEEPARRSGERARLQEHDSISRPGSCKVHPFGYSNRRSSCGSDSRCIKHIWCLRGVRNRPAPYDRYNLAVLPDPDKGASWRAYAETRWSAGWLIAEYSLEVCLE